MSDDLYSEREQTEIKHEVLRRYLLVFAEIVGKRWESISYIDGFSGPWNSRDRSHSDTSFDIALSQLRTARDQLSARASTLGVRCCFVEENPASYQLLEAHARTVTDAYIECHNVKFADASRAIERFLAEAPGTFAFFFIDPCGWTGFPMDTLRAMVGFRDAEVLVNFMTFGIRRFADHPSPEQRVHFEQLFGEADYLRCVERYRPAFSYGDALAFAYAESLREKCGFPYVATAPVLHPRKEDVHFHLVYGTRHPKGLKVFKDTEKGAARKTTDIRRRQLDLAGAGDQPLLPFSEEIDLRTHLDRLRERALQHAKATLLQRIRAEGSVAYDGAWRDALFFPQVWEADLKEWIAEWQASGAVEVMGISARQRKPQYGCGVMLCCPKRG